MYLIKDDYNKSVVPGLVTDGRWSRKVALWISLWHLNDEFLVVTKKDWHELEDFKVTN